MVKVPALKRTRDAAIQALPPPSSVRLPLHGLVPVVSPGQKVEAGALVAREAPGSRWELRRHAPIGGRVVANGADLTIEGSPGPIRPIETRSLDVASIAREAGLVGMGGAMFPTYVKLTPGPRLIEWVIVNGSESEPFVTCDHRVLVEHTGQVRSGLDHARRSLGAAHGGIVGTEPYPGGDERLLVERVTGRELGRGRRPAFAGAAVLNVQSVRALHRAVEEGRPLVDRVITVDGEAVGRPGNWEVPIGTSVGHILQACGTDVARVARIVCGGPMMGTPATLETPVTAGTIAVLALTAQELPAWVDEPCLRCGGCLSACPYGLAPAHLIRRPGPSLQQCVECGICQFVCPARRPLVGLLRQAKQALDAVNPPDAAERRAS